MKQNNRLNKILLIILSVSMAILLVAVGWVALDAFVFSDEEEAASDQGSQTASTLTAIDISEQEPEPEPEPVFEEYDLKLMMVGDNLMHMGIVNAGLQDDGSYDYSYLFEEIQMYLGLADIKMINQETIMGGDERGLSGYPLFNSPSATAGSLNEAGFNVVCHATNHTCDQGLEGLLHNVELWKQYPDVMVVGMHGKDDVPSAETQQPQTAPREEARPVNTDQNTSEDVDGDSTAESTANAGSLFSPLIAHAAEAETGTGTQDEEWASAPVHTQKFGTANDYAMLEKDGICYMQIRDVTFAILNYTYGPNMGSLPKAWEPHLEELNYVDESSRMIDFDTINPKVISDIKKAREKADIVIVAPHWGVEYATVQTPTQEKLAKEMAMAGADLIIGTHPHVPEPIAWIEGENGHRTLCYYSLGNFTSTQQRVETILEEMAWVTFHVTEEGAYIDEDKTGVIPLVNQYTVGPIRGKQVYPLENYTQELADGHGIRSWGGVSFTVDKMWSLSNQIMGGWLISVDEEGNVTRISGNPNAAPDVTDGSSSDEGATEAAPEAPAPPSEPPAQTPVEGTEAAPADDSAEVPAA